MISNHVTACREHAGRRGLSGRALARGLLALFVLGCGPSPDDPLPAMDDLYVYSLAVAEKARLKVPEQEARAHLNLGQVHERFGFDDRALAEYDKAIECDADLGAAYQRIGFILSQRGNRMTEAINAYRQTLRCDSRATGVYARLGLIFLHQGRLDEVVEAIKKEHNQPRAASAESYYCLGQAFSKQGKTAEAIAAFRSAVQRDPRMRSAHYALAMELKISGDTAGFETSLERFRDLNPADSSGGARFEQNEDSRSRERRFAAQTWIDAAALYRRSALAARTIESPKEKRKARARTETFMSESLAALEAAVQVDESDFEAWDTYFDVLRGQEKREAALDVARRATKAMPANGTWPYRAALLQLQLAQAGIDAAKRYREAVALLEDATRKAPDFAPAHFRLAQTLLTALNPRTGDLVRRAVEHASKAVELDPAPGHYDILAFGYHLTGRVDLAQQCLVKGIRKNPGASTLKLHLDKLRKSLERPR